MADPAAGRASGDGRPDAEVRPSGRIDLSRPRRAHVLNAGGAGMSAVAVLLAETGHAVTGHDPAAHTPFLPVLRAAGVDVATGAPPPPLADDVEVVITSTATPDDDPAVVAARRRGVPVVHRAAALGSLCALRRSIAVAGTHGKTTTSALLTTILRAAGQAPGWVIGAPVAGLGTSAAWGGDGPLVVEADESDRTFLALGADAAVVTNVEPDHLDHWGSELDLVEGFHRFATAIPGFLVVGADDPGARALAAVSPHAVTYGHGDDATYRVAAVRSTGLDVTFELAHGPDHVAVRVPQVPGEHNALNAAAALACAHQLGVPLAEGAAALASFGGVARRFERRGEAGGVTFVDDYAHLPTEVAAALRAGRQGGWRRVVAVFQPHRFTRTERLARSFADAFVDADVVCLTEVYPAGEAPRAGVSGKLVVDAVLDAHPFARVAWLPGLDDVAAYLRQELRPGDLCLTLGAGDITTVPDRFLGRAGGGSP